MSIFASRLRQQRQSLHLSQKDMAARCSIPYSTYRHYESDAGMPPLATAVTMAGVLGVSLDYLVGMTDSPSPGAPPIPPAPSNADVILEKIRKLLEEADDLDG